MGKDLNFLVARFKRERIAQVNEQRHLQRLELEKGWDEDRRIDAWREWEKYDARQAAKIERKREQKLMWDEEYEVKSLHDRNTTPYMLRKERKVL